LNIIFPHMFARSWCRFYLNNVYYRWH